MKPPTDMFDDIAKYVPEEHLPEFWRVMAHLRQLKPDDEILRIFQAMGVLTFILRDLPSALIAERQEWKSQLDAFRADITEIGEGINRDAVAVENKSELLSRNLEYHATLYCEASNRLEKASQEAVKQIDVDAMAERLTASIEERVIKPFQVIAINIDQKVILMEKADKQLNTSINTHRRINVWPLVGGISVGILALSMGAVIYGLNEIKAADKVALDEKLAQIQLMADSNKEAFAELTKDQIHIEIAGVSGGSGQPEHGQKCLRVTPSAGVREDTPENQPKSGLIFFQVPETWSEKAVEEWGH
jgi:hypothetical protein